MAGDVLVIGDCTVCQTLGPALEDAGFHVVGARDSLDGLQHLKKGTHRIVILSEDASLKENMSILPMVMRQTSTPVIVVGSGDKQALVDSLTQGADVHYTYPEPPQSAWSWPTSERFYVVIRPSPIT